MGTRDLLSFQKNNFQHRMFRSRTGKVFHHGRSPNLRNLKKIICYKIININIQPHILKFPLTGYPNHLVVQITAFSFTNFLPTLFCISFFRMPLDPIPQKFISHHKYLLAEVRTLFNPNKLVLHILHYASLLYRTCGRIMEKIINWGTFTFNDGAIFSDP